jgi:hypothetical protein
MLEVLLVLEAHLNDAYNPIRYAITKQASQEAATLLLGSVSQIR